MRRLIFATLLLFACQGRREPPLTAGPGVLLEAGDASRSLAIDPTKVPLLETCRSGEVVIRGEGTNWACTPGAPLASSGLGATIQSLKDSVSMLDADVRFLEDRAEDLSDDLRQLSDQLAQKSQADARLAYGFPASACAPASTEVLARMSQTSGDGLDFRSGTTGVITLYCPVIASSPGIAWNDLAIRYRDTDGVDPGGEARAALKYLDPGGTVTEVTSVSSNSNPSVEQAEANINFAHVYEFEQRHYFVELTISRVNTISVPEIYGFQLTTR